MNINELITKINNDKLDELDYAEILNWCYKALPHIDFNNNDVIKLYELSMIYLFKYKIGKWTKEDAITVIHFLAKKSAHIMKIGENINIYILDEGKYKEQCGEGSNAICTNNGDNTFDITYSYAVISNLLACDYDIFLRGLQTLFHEVVHAMQNSFIQNAFIKDKETPISKTTYLMTLETIVRKFVPQFYKKNYSRLLKENHAELVGLILAMDTMKKYNQKLYNAYDEEIIKKKIDKYNQNYYDAKVILNNGTEIEFIRNIDALSSIYIESHPELIQKFPILKVGYNSDGSKKK